MEGFIEQVVKRDKTTKNLVIKIFSVIMLFAIPLGFVLLARWIPYMALVGFFVFLGGIYVVWWIFSSQKVEFEYAVNGDTLDVAKVISLRKRKRVCSVAIKDIEEIEIGDKDIRDRHFRKIYIAAKNMNDVDSNYYAVFTEPAYGKCLLVFNPNDTILQAMKPYMNKNLVIQLFYKRQK